MEEDSSKTPEASPSSGKRKSRTSDIEPRSSAKRQRVPVSRFQSPLEDLEPKFKSEKEDKKDENVMLYKKNCFLAVRGAEDSFYLCRTTQNVYKKSKRLKIQWLNLVTPPDIYKLDYADGTEMETVLTEISMSKSSKDSFKLPSEEKRRIEKILDRALRVEKGIATADEVAEEALDDLDDSEEDSEEEYVEQTPKRGRKNERKSTTPKGRQSKSTPASKKKGKASTDKKSKSGKKVKEEKKKGPDRHLKPNPKIKVLEKDPFFETKEKTSRLSPHMTSKLAFRAVNLNDEQMLKELLDKKEGVVGFNLNRSVHHEVSPLDCAMLQGKEEMIKLLTKECYVNSKRKTPPALLISSIGTGEYNPMSLGVGNIRALNVSRGGKEGNEAFMKDIVQHADGFNHESISKWMSKGVSVEAIEAYILAQVAANERYSRDQVLQNDIIDHVFDAVIHGHRRLAAKYMAEAERLGGFGINYLHKEVLTFEKEDLRDIILAASVRKKPFGNNGITPLHCAAINPNVKYLTRLLSIEPDLNMQTRAKARPIHFAAACEGTGPLEFLLNRNASPYEPDTSGEIPIHFASKSGRAKNIEVLVKYANSRVDESVNPKWGIGCVNRPNRFSYTPLHLAVIGKHIDAIRTLLKHGAEINKPLSAGKDKVTPLMLAAQQGDLSIARLLIQSGASVEILDKLKRSALTHAIMNGCANVASYLLMLGADPNRVDSSNNSLVHYAAAYGWQTCLKLLLKDAGARPDVPNDWQTTPINIAFLMGNYGLVEYLFNNKGVDINFKSDTGRTLVSVASGSRLVAGLDEQIKYLIESCKADATIADVNGMNPLHYLAKNNIKLKGHYYRNAEICEEAQALSVKIAEVLIDAGCDIMLKNKEGKTPIMLAIEQVNVDLVKFMVERGGYITPEQNRDEKTVLHLMAEHCCVSDLRPIIKIVLEHKRKAISPEKAASKVENMENGHAETVSNDADKETGMEVDSTDKPMTESEKVADINGVNEKEPMEVEENQDKTKTGNDNVSNGPELTPQESLKKMLCTRDFLGFTPILRACQMYRDYKVSNEEDKKHAGFALGFIKELLQLSPSNVNDVVGPKNMQDVKEPKYSDDGKNSALHFMIKADDSEKKLLGPGLELLLRFNPDPNTLNIKEKSPLILAVEANKDMAVKALLEIGADPNIQIKVPQDTVSPLILAAERGAFNIMNLLIKAKADVGPCGTRKLTPLHVLVTIRAHEDETIAMIQTLLEAKADINAATQTGDSPLHLAVKYNKGHSDTSNSLEEFLLDSGANVFATNNYLRMPLHIAVAKDSMDPIELCSLLTNSMRDQRVDEPDKHGFTPLLNAAMKGSTICCMHLLQRRANLEAKEYRGNTALNLAVYNGHDSCAIMLMQREASVKNPIVIRLAEKREDQKKEEEKAKKRPLLVWRPKRQWTDANNKDIPEERISIFQSAIHHNLTGVAHMLLDSIGVPMDVIEAALNLSKFYLALRLLRRIPDASRLQAKNKDGQNLFHVLAAKTSNQHPELQIKVAGALLEKGVPLNERDNFGMTPLMWAAIKHQSITLARFFIENDLRYDPKVKDIFGRDAVAAFMWDYNWISDPFKVPLVESWLKLLLEEGKMSLDTTYDHPLPDPLLLGAKISCSQPDYFETKSASRTTPLIFAIRNYDFGIAKFMLQNGANPNYSDSNGMTPMMHAVIMNDLKMVKLLLNYSYSASEDDLEYESKTKLVSQSSRQVFPINFEAAKEKNPDDLIDEEEGADEQEEDDVSLSKHTEEMEESVVLDDDEPEIDEELELEDNEGEDDGDDDEENSDHDTDVMEDEDNEDESGDKTKVVTKLSLTRHVSRLNDEKIYKSIEKTSNVDLSICDKNLWTSLHHAVCALDYASFDNAEIVYVLGKAGAPLEAKNDKGETPLSLAHKNDSVKIVKVLNQLLVQADKSAESFKNSPPPFEVQELMGNKTKPDYHSDSQSLLEKEVEDKAAKEVIKVDDNCEIKSAGELAHNESTNIPYHVILSKVDVSLGLHGKYNFYKMQIIKHKAKNLFILFTRWGRIGDRGQFQHTPFQSLSDAAKEFCKVYKSKTGNDWNQKTQFQNHPKKYRLMNVVDKLPKAKKINFNFETSPPTTLPEPIFDVVNEMSSVSMFDASVENVGLDEDIMPFGRIKRDVLLQARKILTDISENIDRLSKLRNNLTKETEAEYQTCSEELIKLTNEYYHLVPISGFANESIRPIHDKQNLRKQTKLLNDLLDLQIANTILLGAKFRKEELNPVDYVYSSLGCRIQPLPEEHPEAQLILTNIHASVPTASINRIYKISREGENERLSATNIPNHQLLWHGSSMSNFISILSRGLLVTPPEVPWSGHLFGEGIYFADTFLKSMHYCHNHNPKSHCKVMLLCEVALGNSKVGVVHSDEDHLDADINSLKILGRAAPIEDYDARFPYGASLSLGQVQTMQYKPPAVIAHNEYIIHNAEQIALRYMVLFNG